jgi:predicted ArsR family transcriptional regulator
MPDITEIEHQILVHLGKSERVSFNGITSALNLNPITTRFRLNDLSNLGLVELWGNAGTAAEYWALTQKGRKYLADREETAP